MSQPIFGAEAPKYFAKRMSVIPLQPRSKKPFLDNWQQWHESFAFEEVQKTWLEQHAYGNIGLVLGKQSGVMIVDVDSEDPAVVKAIEAVLPKTPWKRIGAKGYGAAYKFNGQKTFRIDDKNGVRLVDVLSSRSQLVLPPSIHPDTGLAYTSNCNLYDVLDDLVMLPENFEDLLRASLTAHGIEVKSEKGGFNSSVAISKGSRDTSMVRNAGKLANGVLRGEITLKRAMDDMIAWADLYITPDPNDPLDVDKGVGQIISWLLTDINNKNRILPPGWDEGITEEQKKQWNLIFTEDQREWTLTEIMEYLDKQLKTHEGANNPERAKTVEFTLKKIHQSRSLSVLEQEKIFQFMSKHCGGNVPVSTYKKRLKEISQGEDILGVNHTEIAEAAIAEFVRQVGEIRFHAGTFWKWEGSHWAPVEDEDVERVIQTTFGHMDAAKKYSDITGIRKSMRNLVTRGIKVLDVEGVNFSNGFLTTELKLIPHDPRYGMTYTLPFRYRPEEAYRAYQFEALLHSFWGHQKDFVDKKKALQEAMCALIFGIAPRYNRAVCLYGPGGSGKSQLLDILTFLVPDQSRSAIPPEKWGEDFTLVNFYGKLLNICGELDDKKYLTSKNFKEVIDGTEIEARQLYSEPFKFRCTASHWFGSNHLPKSKDTTGGFNRRWLFFKFDRKVKQQNKVLEIGKKIGREEIEAIAAWAISIAPEFTTRKIPDYTLCESHVELEESMSLQNSTIRQWMKEKVFVKEGATLSQEELADKYWAYVVGNLRDKPIPKRKFYSDFEQFNSETETFPRIVEGDNVRYLNIGVKDGIEKK